jgi:hypothetical protein
MGEGMKMQSDRPQTNDRPRWKFIRAPGYRSFLLRLFGWWINLTLSKVRDV